MRATAKRTFAIYAAAGVFAVDRSDPLPADACFDLVHVNSDGMRVFSHELASMLIDAGRQDREQ